MPCSKVVKFMNSSKKSNINANDDMCLMYILIIPVLSFLGQILASGGDGKQHFHENMTLNIV